MSATSAHCNSKSCSGQRSCGRVPSPGNLRRSGAPRDLGDQVAQASLDSAADVAKQVYATVFKTDPTRDAGSSPAVGTMDKTRYH